MRRPGGRPQVGTRIGIFQLLCQKLTVVLGFLALPLQILKVHLVDERLLALLDEVDISGNTRVLEGLDGENLSGFDGLEGRVADFEAGESDGLLSEAIPQDAGVVSIDFHGSGNLCLQCRDFDVLVDDLLV